jgi:Mg2+-importing ATPase
MSFFGPISSIYNFLTFAVMLWMFHAGEKLFQTGWFVESLATQSLVIFVIRTRRVPFYRSRPSRPLLGATVAVACLGVLLPFIPPVAHAFGFTPLPAAFLGILMLMIGSYLLLVEFGQAALLPVGARPCSTGSPTSASTSAEAATARAFMWARWDFSSYARS